MTMLNTTRYRAKPPAASLDGFSANRTRWHWCAMAVVALPLLKRACATPAVLTPAGSVAAAVGACFYSPVCKVLVVVFAVASFTQCFAVVNDKSQINAGRPRLNVMRIESHALRIASLASEIVTREDRFSPFSDFSCQSFSLSCGDAAFPSRMKWTKGGSASTASATELGSLVPRTKHRLEHRLLGGDATSGEDVGRVLDGNEPCLMVTDPPYGVNYDPNWRNEAAAKGQLAFAARRVGKVSNDDRIDWSEAYLLFPGDVAYTWSPPGDNQILTGQAVQKGGFQIRNQIMWRKPHFPISRGHYTYQHEPCWYGVRKGRTSHWIGDNAASTVWDITLDKNVEGGHSTQKPLECMARPIRNHEGDVYDPFVGSGTTLVAAENLGRRCFALEIEPRYCAVAIERMTAMDCKASKASSD